MKILFTGGSSFTGFWFVKELATAGHEVTTTFRRPSNDYADKVRHERVEQLTPITKPVFNLSFGDDRFLELIKQNKFDVLCHHAADVTNYRSPDFNVLQAFQNNTSGLLAVISSLRETGCCKIVLTGSVFENDEGTGSGHGEAFSAYGLSKGLTWQMFRYYAQRHQISLGKFVIPNPFGPYEEPRFPQYLIKNWFAGSTPAVGTPVYVRDNIHVSLLAKVYSQFVFGLSPGFSRINPCGYIETQASFAYRVAREMSKRLNLKCDLTLSDQTDFSEPIVRINTDVPNAKMLKWSEEAAWDEMADYYARTLAHS